MNLTGEDDMNLVESIDSVNALVYIIIAFIVGYIIAKMDE